MKLPSCALKSSSERKIHILSRHIDGQNSLEFFFFLEVEERGEKCMCVHRSNSGGSCILSLNCGTAISLSVNKHQRTGETKKLSNLMLSEESG